MNTIKQIYQCPNKTIVEIALDHGLTTADLLKCNVTPSPLLFGEKPTAENAGDTPETQKLYKRDIYLHLYTN